MAYLTTTTANDSAILARITGAIDTLTTRIKQRKLYRETFDGLSALSNRELADLGLDRSELRAVAWDAARNAIR